MQNLCEYGCGNVAIKQLKNKKWCCSDSWNSCSVNTQRNSNGVKDAYRSGKLVPHDGKLIYKEFPKETKDRMAWARGKNRLTDNKIRITYTDEQIFSENGLVSRRNVKQRLLLEANYIHECALCKLKEWRDPISMEMKPINLELDHINGIRNDNKRENLRFVCGNCHSYTPTYKGKNINNLKAKVSDDMLIHELKTKNIHQSLISVGLVPVGANYDRCKKLLTYIKYTIT